VGEVAVDLDEVVVAAFESPGEPGPVRATEAALGRAVKDLDLSEVVRGLLSELSGAVGARVVHNQDVATGDDLAQRAQHRLDVQDLVVRG
jgi:hypothetical protein